MEASKTCPKGKYYCYDEKKCKKIPRGYRIGARGYLAREKDDDSDESKKKNGNGGNGNGTSNGNSNGGNGGNGGANGGGMSEETNPRIARKKGQPAKSKKHSDLYTDEDPKGTIHGLGFKDVAKAKASVSKIRNSSRSHAHKIQAAVAMEQRAREMGKTSEAAVYRKYINTMKKKTKKMNEALEPIKNTLKNIKKDIKTASIKNSFKGRDVSKKEMSKYQNKINQEYKDVTNPKDPNTLENLLKNKNGNGMTTEGLDNHSDVGLITNAVVELENGLLELNVITYDSVDQLMQGIAKRNNISPTLLHNQFKAKHLQIPDDWAITKRMLKRRGMKEGVTIFRRKNKREERKPQKAMDAGARAKRKLQRREYASTVSGSEDRVPDYMREAKMTKKQVKNLETTKLLTT